MELEWQLDNPAIALEHYHNNIEEFRKIKTEYSMLKEEVLLKQKELNEKNAEVAKYQNKLNSMGEYVSENLDKKIQSIGDEIYRKTKNEDQKFESKKQALALKRDKELKENDEWLKNRLEQLFGSHVDTGKELNELEKRALEFEMDRRKFVISSNEKINSMQDAIAQENLECESEVEVLKGEQDRIYSAYEPELLKHKEVINDIKKKHQSNIVACQNVLAEKVAQQEAELNQLQNEKNREIQFVNAEIEGYRRDYKQAEKQFNEQIRMAKLQNKPTTRMENSKVTRLNSINDQIQKANNRISKKVLSLEQKIEATQSKHFKIVEKAENQLNDVISKRDRELAQPIASYNGLITNRDEKIAELQQKIDARENIRNTKINNWNVNIENERQAQNNKNSSVDQQILKYVMENDNCFSDVMDEEFAPFIALKVRINTWMGLLSEIEKEKLQEKYPKEAEKQKHLLIQKNYVEMQQELAETGQFKDEISVFAKNTKNFNIVGGSLAGLGLLMIIVLYAVLKISLGLVGIGLMIAGICIACFAVYKTQKEFSSICKYISLANDYKEFTSLVEHSTKVTQERELAKMKELGDELFNFHYGKEEAQKIHDAKDADIKEDYERDLRHVSYEYSSTVRQFERESQKEIQRITSEATDKEEAFNNEKEHLQEQVRSTNMRIKNLNERIDELDSEIIRTTEIIEKFEDNYRILENQLQNDKWIAPMPYTHGKLNNTLYIVPDGGERDEYQHKKIYRVAHNKKALVVNYDISTVPEEKVEQVNKIIHDLIFDIMYSVYRMNSKETYLQYVVDEMVATNDLKSTNVKNAFNICEVVSRMEDVKGRLREFSAQREKIAEKGTNMDAINESKFNSQDRPETYNILYIIYKPNERKSKLDDEIRVLIPECEKYGFLPIFICEKETWERGIQEKESIYKDIKNLTDNSIIVFDGKNYNIAVNE